MRLVNKLEIYLAQICTPPDRSNCYFHHDLVIFQLQVNCTLKLFIKECFIYPEKPRVVGHLCHVTLGTPPSIVHVEDGNAGDFGQPASTQCRNLVLQLRVCLLIKYHFISVTIRLVQEIAALPQFEGAKLIMLLLVIALCCPSRAAEPSHWRASCSFTEFSPERRCKLISAHLS